MICPRCLSDIPDNSKFCNQCGQKLKFCSYCQQPNIDNARFCIHCGQPFDLRERVERPQTHTSTYGTYVPTGETMPVDEGPMYDERDYRKVNWKVIIIAVVVFVMVITSSIVYIKSTPSLNFRKEENQKTEDTSQRTERETDISGNATFTAVKSSTLEKYSNLANISGFVCDGTYIFMTDNSGKLVRLNSDFSDPVILDATAANFINDAGDRLYYADENYRICTIQKDGTGKQILVDSASYYLTYEDGKIYYQNDADNESLYVYDIKAEKSKKLVNRHLYNLNIVDGKVYYNGQDGVYCYDLGTKKDERLVEGKSYNVICHDGYLYYVTGDAALQRYSLANHTTEDIVSTTSVYSMVMNEKAIYFYGGSSLLNRTGKIYRIDLETKDVTTVYEGILADSNDFQVIGDQLLVKEAKGWITVNTQTGKQGTVFKS